MNVVRKILHVLRAARAKVASGWTQNSFAHIVATAPCIDLILQCWKSVGGIVKER